MDQCRQEFKLLGNQVKLDSPSTLDPSFEQQLVNLFRKYFLQLGTLNGEPGTF
ncbi:MAG: hypothetical protein R2778_12925 [Saprospiraceae bacterium]